MGLKMIYGIGTDIVNISRIKKVFNKDPSGLISRILSKQEQEVIETISDNDRKISYLAKRFAGKEALSKALGSGIGKDIAFKDISILNDSIGKPFIQLEKPLEDQVKIDLSLSDDHPFALAFVIISG